MTPAVHRLSEGVGSRMVTIGCRASEGILPCFPATNHRLDGRRTGQKGWRNLACRESLPHKEEALIKPSWGREFL